MNLAKRKLVIATLMCFVLLFGLLLVIIAAGKSGVSLSESAAGLTIAGLVFVIIGYIGAFVCGIILAIQNTPLGPFPQEIRNLIIVVSILLLLAPFLAWIFGLVGIFSKSWLGVTPVEAIDDKITEKSRQRRESRQRKLEQIVATRSLKTRLRTPYQAIIALFCADLLILFTAIVAILTFSNLNGIIHGFYLWAPYFGLEFGAIGLISSWVIGVILIVYRFKLGTPQEFRNDLLWGGILIFFIPVLAGLFFHIHAFKNLHMQIKNSKSSVVANAN